MSFSLSRRRLVAAGVAGLLGAAGLASGAAAAPAKSTRALPGVVPEWVTSAHKLGHARGSDAVEFGVLLSMRNAAAAPSLIRSLTTPGSTQYGRWLTAAQFRARFAPAAGDVAAVQKWLRDAGFRVDETLSSGLLVQASGSVAQTEKAFGTRLDQFSYRGHTLRAPAAQLRVPATMPSAVASITGLADTPKQTASKPPPGPAPGLRTGFQPCSAFYGQKIATTLPPAYGQKVPYAVCGYTSKELATAYGVSPAAAHGADGSGVTVAVTDAYASPTIKQDANTYSTRHGLPTFTPGQFRQILPPRFNQYKLCHAQDWYGEETLDVEAVHGVAPGAKIVYVGGSNCLGGLGLAWAKTIDNHVADVVTNSWGEGTEDLPLSAVRVYDMFAREAALTGISVLFPSGDSGDSVLATQKRQVALPASDPYITGVGGTSVAIGASGQKVFEHGWENAYSTLTNGAWTPKPPGAYTSGSSGGTSRLFRQPWYQRGVVPASISKYFGTVATRAVPDVSMPGDPNTGMRVGQTQAFGNGTYYDEYRIGGTSLSSPLLAGVLAVAEQYNQHPIGFLNPLAYALVGTAAITDVLPPSHPIAEARVDFNNGVNAKAGLLYRLQTIDVPTTIRTRVGYDDVTGVGTPNGLDFLKGIG
ncbi:MAG: S53 family peptidase [Frankiaceae bacterium]